MKNHYKHIFFDLDHTLWDFEANSNETLGDLYEIYDFDQFGFKLPQFLEIYHIENALLWNDYNHGRINQEELRKTRFTRVLTALGLNTEQVPLGIDEKYLEICPKKPYVMPHTFTILDYLRKDYDLHIITNGFEDVQAIKLSTSGLKDYFEGVITSELAGYKKPSREIFDFAMEHTNSDRAQSIMIGDNLETDIAGAKNAELDQVFFNPAKVDHSAKPTYEIHGLNELMNIL